MESTVTYFADQSCPTLKDNILYFRENHLRSINYLLKIFYDSEYFCQYSNFKELKVQLAKILSKNLVITHLSLSLRVPHLLGITCNVEKLRNTVVIRDFESPVEIGTALTKVLFDNGLAALIDN